MKDYFFKILSEVLLYYDLLILPFLLFMSPLKFGLLENKSLVKIGSVSNKNYLCSADVVWMRVLLQMHDLGLDCTALNLDPLRSDGLWGRDKGVSWEEQMELTLTKSFLLQMLLNT